MYAAHRRTTCRGSRVTELSGDNNEVVATINDCTLRKVCVLPSGTTLHNKSPREIWWLANHSLVILITSPIKFNGASRDHTRIKVLLARACVTSISLPTTRPTDTHHLSVVLAASTTPTRRPRPRKRTTSVPVQPGEIVLACLSMCFAPNHRGAFGTAGPPAAHLQPAFLQGHTQPWPAAAHRHARPERGGPPLAAGDGQRCQRAAGARGG